MAVDLTEVKEADVAHVKFVPKPPLVACSLRCAQSREDDELITNLLPTAARFGNVMLEGRSERRDCYTRSNYQP